MSKVFLVLGFLTAGFLSLPAHAKRFDTETKDGDILLTDNQSGFQWTYSDILEKTWEEAIAYCENLTYAGLSDWQLPPRYDLRVLEFETASLNPEKAMPNRPKGLVWSFSNDKKDVCAVNFDNGSSFCAKPGKRLHSVRCVRAAN